MLISDRPRRDRQAAIDQKIGIVGMFMVGGSSQSCIIIQNGSG